MIVGLGTDVIEIARIRRSLERFGRRFTERIFTAGEITYCESRGVGRAESYAARFAAKEAAAKALGTGIARGVTWLEIEITRLPGRPPQIAFSGRAAERAATLGVVNSSLSLTHARDFALAVVALESGG